MYAMAVKHARDREIIMKQEIADLIDKGILSVVQHEPREIFPIYSEKFRNLLEHSETEHFH